ncbi:ATP-dependent endonuclease [Methanoculleus sp.]|uniref:ATP-dependent nuclease n=1 Tax=Methanoculleus sp. TaxID=90427 RepID=UPI001BD33446|nr:AAA family ATPase [Methanoculleus sp.]
MKLINAQVTNFKSIDDSEVVNFDNVTCLVGKNESGKTAFLQALMRLNPIEKSKGNFDILDYPRKGYTRYRQIHEKNPADVVHALFELTDEEMAQIEAALGHNIIPSRQITITKNYKNELRWDFKTDEKKAVHGILEKSDLTDSQKKSLEHINTIPELVSVLKTMADGNSSVTDLHTRLQSAFLKGLEYHIINNYLERFLPYFVYFGDYYAINGRISIQYLRQRRDSNQLSEADRTFLSLLELSGNKLEDFENQQNFERLNAEMESASITVTDQVFEYWTQNKQLEVEFAISPANPADLAPLNQGTILHIRVKNNRHRVSVPFDERSRGFIWFFSFFAYFSQIEDKNRDLILLLDEPGLSLHAKAQGDFLRFIEERLAPKHQVIYTTHSPFMIEPTKLNQVRMVEDVDAKGTKITEDVLKNDMDTVFPIQAALGYDLAQTLFIGPNCLLVEGPSDLIYLQILSEIVQENGLSRLDPRWVITPVGGADKVSTFVSLLGSNKLNIAVLMDVAKKDRQRIDNLKANAILGQNNLIQVGEFTGARDADIEDLFDRDFYLTLVNGAYQQVLPAKLTPEVFTNENPRITKRLEDYFEQNNIDNGEFSHFKPAAYLLKNQAELAGLIGISTIQRAGKLFERINTLL